MARAFNVRIKGLDAVKRKFLRASRGNVIKEMKKTVLILTTKMAADARSAAPRRTGHLRKSIRPTVEKNTKGVIGRVGSPLVYARMQERGGTQKPRRAKYLTIPLPAAKTRAGVTRGSARSFRNTFIFRSKAGNLIIAQRRGRGEFVPLFVLKKSVEIPASPYLEPALEKNRGTIIRTFGTRMKALLS